MPIQLAAAATAESGEGNEKIRSRKVTVSTVPSGTRGNSTALTWGFCGGGERTRTADFHVANVALYQLSYTPELGPRIRRAVRSDRERIVEAQNSTARW